MAEKKSEFVVTDRRRFGTEGEPRPDAQIAEEEKPSTKPAAPATPPAAKTTAPPLPPPPPPSQSAQTQAQPGPPATEQEEEMSPPPTAEEEHAQSEAYKASGKKIDDMISAAGKTPQGGPLEMSFERVIESFYMSALIQMGAIRQDNEPPRVDIIGARQTIDSLAILQEKTKGNLTDREKTLLQNVLFELRMAFIEITNAVATSATKPGAVPPGAMPPLDKK
jgi:type IV secretory pathway VirB10-like protein